MCACLYGALAAASHCFDGKVKAEYVVRPRAIKRLKEMLNDMIREEDLVCIVVEEGLKLFNSNFVRVIVSERIVVSNFYFCVYDEQV